MQKRSAQGFTLLEMSIVLIIIGVLIGGVMLGRSMLTTSRLQTVITDADSYITAMGNFKQQYLGLPGDLATATSLWGTDSNGCPTGGGSTGTCNGNGDGMIGDVTGQEYEVFRFWQHLYYAGMFSQSLSGVAGSGGVYAAVTSTNVPTGSISGSGFTPIWEGTAGGSDSNFFAGSYGNILIFGAPGTFMTSYPVLTADQAASIDSKIDDGVPGTGKVRAFISTSSYTPNCTTTAVVATSVYNVSNTSGKLCSLIFTTGY